MLTRSFYWIQCSTSKGLVQTVVIDLATAAAVTAGTDMSNLYEYYLYAKVFWSRYVDIDIISIIIDKTVVLFVLSPQRYCQINSYYELACIIRANDFHFHFSVVFYFLGRSKRKGQHFLFIFIFFNAVFCYLISSCVGGDVSWNTNKILHAIYYFYLFDRRERARLMWSHMVFVFGGV